MKRWYVSLTAEYECVIEAESLEAANEHARHVIANARLGMPNCWDFDTLEVCEASADCPLTSQKVRSDG